VHENQYLADVLERNSRLKVLDENFDHPKDVVAEARRFMGASIVAYMNLTEKTGLSIDEIGELMDDAVLGVDSSELFG
jgi:ribosome assembly protein YihI (activator of Der GTPase)